MIKCNPYSFLAQLTSGPFITPRVHADTPQADLAFVHNGVWGSTRFGTAPGDRRCGGGGGAEDTADKLPHQETRGDRSERQPGGGGSGDATGGDCKPC